MTSEEILKEVTDNFAGGAKRRFLPGLLIAFIDFLRRLDAHSNRFKSLEAFYRVYPQVTQDKQGRKNTLIVKLPDGKTLGIRPFYNEIENWFRVENHRYDYPSSAPHATQAWTDYRHWLESLLAFDPAALLALETAAKDFVLKALPSQAIDTASIIKAPPLFLHFLEDFDFVAPKGEPSGAAYQGAVFGYLRADSPHLQVEVGKVRTGSKREKRVGDVDARDADALILSAEVKQFVFAESDISEISEFSNLIAEHKAIGLVVALDFKEGAREKIKALGLEAVSKTDLIERVRLWDPLKQRSAINAVLYYAGFREKNSVLKMRIRATVAAIEANTLAMRKKVSQGTRIRFSRAKRKK